MRITGGTLKGRRVQFSKGVIRPAMDRMRESVFAILGDLEGVSFLDIFSGSGIIALEAASRGASYIEAVENDPLKRYSILDNIKMSPVRIQCRFMPAELYVKRAKRHFDIIFCDPPFPYRHKEGLLKSIASSVLVNEETRILLHCPKSEVLGDFGEKLTLKETREYGRSAVIFFKICCD